MKISPMVLRVLDQLKIVVARREREKDVGGEGRE